jgi:hypothetical protein
LTECACCQTRSVKGITKLGSAIKINRNHAISDVNAAYYDLVQQQQRFAILIVISNQRLTLAQNRFTIGKAQT